MQCQELDSIQRKRRESICKYPSNDKRVATKNCFKLLEMVMLGASTTAVRRSIPGGMRRATLPNVSHCACPRQTK
jgi:hypothetical protein